MTYFEMDALLALVLLSGVFGFLLGKQGISGIVSDITNLKNDVTNLKVVTAPITPTPVVTTVAKPV